MSEGREIDTEAFLDDVLLPSMATRARHAVARSVSKNLELKYGEKIYFRHVRLSHLLQLSYEEILGGRLVSPHVISQLKAALSTIGIELPELSRSELVAMAGDPDDRFAATLQAEFPLILNLSQATAAGLLDTNMVTPSQRLVYGKFLLAAAQLSNSLGGLGAGTDTPDTRTSDGSSIADM